MTRAARPADLAGRTQFALAIAILCALASVLIWTLWVLPIAASVGSADARPIGRAATVELAAGESIGIWGRGVSANLGTMACVVTAPNGEEVRQGSGPSLDWSDTLWWMTPQWGFEQFSQVTASAAGDHQVRCRDSLDTYDGEFLVAGDSFGNGSVGLGRTGGSDFAVGSLLSFGAVFFPPVAVMLAIIVAIRGIRLRRVRRNSERAAR